MCARARACRAAAVSVLSESLPSGPVRARLAGGCEAPHTQLHTAGARNTSWARPAAAAAATMASPSSSSRGQYEEEEDGAYAYDSQAKRLKPSEGRREAAPRSGGFSAGPTRLNVFRNDNDSWDYTKPYMGRQDRGKGHQRQALLGEHPSSFRHDGYGSHGPLLPFPSQYRTASCDTPELVAYPLPQASSSYYMHGGNSSSSVAMVSGLHQQKMNCSRVFNLFCLYGNIERVNFMKTIPGTALVEMGDEYAVERAVTHLNNVKLFGKRLTVCVSKQHSVIPSQIYELEDGTRSYKDFAMSKNNRFLSARKDIIRPPSCVLHYYNVPLCVTKETFVKLCEDHEVLSFIKYKVFDPKPSSKTLSGLLEWPSKTDAVEALTVLNHYPIKVPDGSNPYTLKLCFSLLTKIDM